MATVKVKFRPSRGTAMMGTVAYQINHWRRTTLVSTDICLSKQEWHQMENGEYTQDSHLIKVRNRVQSDVTAIRQIIGRHETTRYPYTARQVAEEFQQINSTAFLAFAERLAEAMEESGRNGTARNYRRAIASMRHFLGRDDFPIRELTAMLVEQYATFLLSRGVTRNTLSFYMRILRAVYNKAVAQKLTEPSEPFRDVYTGVDQTRKRAVDERLIAQLYHLEMPPGSRLSLARDLFVFSYCTRGMAFVDMAFLRKQDIDGQFINYTRRKTHQRLTIRIDTHIRDILEQYAQVGGPYVFPIIKSMVPQRAYKEYEAGLNNYNRQLGILSKQIPGCSRITSYTARHSWATIARKHDIPMAIISEGLGHTSEQTTRIYLKSLENSVLDKANEQILSILDY